MGHVFATIELYNTYDQESVRRGLLDPDELRKMQVDMMVDTGSLYMCINESVRSYLGLPVVGKRRLQLADGTWGQFDIVGPIGVRFGNQSCSADAVVLAEDTQCLLGAMPMEAMNVLINPARQELFVNPNHQLLPILRLSE